MKTWVTVADALTSLVHGYVCTYIHVCIYPLTRGVTLEVAQAIKMKVFFLTTYSTHIHFVRVGWRHCTVEG